MKEGLEKLLRDIRSSDQSKRRSTIQTLGNLGSDEAVEVLLSILEGNVRYYKRLFSWLPLSVSSHYEYNDKIEVIASLSLSKHPKAITWIQKLCEEVVLIDEPGRYVFSDFSNSTSTLCCLNQRVSFPNAPKSLAELLCYEIESVDYTYIGPRSQTITGIDAVSYLPPTEFGEKLKSAYERATNKAIKKDL